MSATIQLSPALATFKQKHPKLFIATICAAIAIPLCFLLNRGTAMPDSLAYYTYPPSRAGDGLNSEEKYPAFGPVSVSAAVDRSEELWSSSKKKRLEFIREKGGSGKMAMFSDKDEPGLGQLYTVWDLYLPSFSCPWEVERVGRIVDGGKYVCGLPRIMAARDDKCVVYSFGVAQESSWEAELLTRTKCEIFAYDFSVDRPGPQIAALDLEQQQRFHFHRFGIGSKNEEKFGYPFYTLKTLMKQNGHDWIDILKVDVEGSEFNVIPDIISEFGKNRLPFDQLLMEIHVDQVQPVGYNFKNFDIWYEGMEAAGLRAFYGELNYPSLHFTNGYPQAFEMNFVNYGNRKRSKGRLLTE